MEAYTKRAIFYDQTNYDKRWVWEVLGEGEEMSQRKHWRTTRILSKRQTDLPYHTPEFWGWFWEIQWASNPGISWGWTPNHGMLPEVTGGIPHPVPFPMPEARTHPRGAAHWLEPPFPMVMEIQWWFFLHQLVLTGNSQLIFCFFGEFSWRWKGNCFNTGCPRIENCLVNLIDASYLHGNLPASTSNIPGFAQDSSGYDCFHKHGTFALIKCSTTCHGLWMQCNTRTSRSSGRHEPVFLATICDLWIVSPQKWEDLVE